MAVTEIMVTGGPGAGKTTGIRLAADRIRASGLNMMVAPEAATIMFNTGVRPDQLGADPSRHVFQDGVYRVTKTIRAACLGIADALYQGRCIILYDRGELDGLVYGNHDDIIRMIEADGTSVQDIVNSYSAVIHMETAAKLSAAHYVTHNNSARTVNPQQAVSEDIRVFKLWARHPDVHTVRAMDDFDEKVDALIGAIMRIAPSWGA